MNYETDETFDFDSSYTVDGYSGIAWYVWGWETEPDEDTEWSGYEQRTGRIVCTMIGDDRKFAFEPEELTILPREDYCEVCGQIGCQGMGTAR